MDRFCYIQATRSYCAVYWGSVVIAFTIHTNYTISEVKVFKSVEKSLDEEALRLIKNGRWIPAIQNGRHVNYRELREIEFRLK